MKKTNGRLDKWEINDYIVFVSIVLALMIMALISVWAYKTHKIKSLRKLQIPLKG